MKRKKATQKGLNKTKKCVVFKEEYINNQEFLNFINQGFNSVASNSTLEELAEFAFGSVEECIKAFEIEKYKDETT